ncbi:hypothetical protein BSKO_10432 [Bryopsis sp. KO-2023]|nr:hypothetical protein BSKO_10432 [Bryopsis sp. KO-2023]
MASIECSSESFSHLVDGGECFRDTCDMSLLVEGTEVPLHSQALIMHSRFFRKLLTDVQKGEVKNCSGGDRLVLTLDPPTRLKDVEMLLQYMYNRHATVDKFEDAIVLVTLADKFDMPSMIKICEPLLCKETANMHFAGYTASMCHAPKRPTSPSHAAQAVSPPCENLDAAKWLSIAERWGLECLKVKCQAIILQALAYTNMGSTKTEDGFQKLQEHRVSLRSIYAIAAVLGQCAAEFGRCPCGKMYSSLQCASCFLENTPRATRDLCEERLFKHSQVYKT